jgi:DNA-binding transcriptional ArsR family regulator
MSPDAGAAPAVIFAALGDPTRLALLARLADGEARSIVALSGDTALTRQAVTKHLRVLERAGLVAQRRMGRESRFAYRPEAMATARSYLDAVTGHWDRALGRLRRLVEE